MAVYSLDAVACALLAYDDTIKVYESNIDLLLEELKVEKGEDFEAWLAEIEDL